MKRLKLKGLTDGLVETLLAISELNTNSQAFKTVDEVARRRLVIRYANGGEAAAKRGYFGMYRSTTYKMLEELSRRGYVDQADKPAKRGPPTDYRPYKITKKGRAKIKEVA